MVKGKVTGSASLKETSLIEARHKEIIKEYYAKRASNYDKQKARTWKSKLGFKKEILGKIMYRILEKKPKFGLEVGFGSGRIGLKIVKRFNLDLIGLDISKQMLILAKQKNFPGRKLHLIVGDADYLPFPNETFDLLLCISVLHYMPSLNKTLEEFSRVMKQNGLLVYGDVTRHELDSKGFIERMERALSPAHWKYYTPDQMREKLKQYNFKIMVTEIFKYRKSYTALIQDKAQYFEGRINAFKKVLESANKTERNLYEMGDKDLTLYYTLIFALRT